MHPSEAPRLTDPAGRTITYLRLSVTDRCDMRCSYCMPPSTTFVPREHLLSLEEQLKLVRVFVGLGVRKVRLTGGEPLARRGMASLVRAIAALPAAPSVVLTTNGTQLARQAAELKAAGLERLNVSLDSLDPANFRRITWTGDLHKVLDGLQAARAAGFERIKLNVVAMRGVNDHEIIGLVEYALRYGFNISFVEEMPFGDVHRNRAATFMSSQQVRDLVSLAFPLIPTTETTGGPARYHRIPGSETRVGFISPHTHNFCESCNRVRVSAAGELYTCLASNRTLPLQHLLRAPDYDAALVEQAIRRAVSLKPDAHRFGSGTGSHPLRFMSRTGG